MKKFMLFAVSLPIILISGCAANPTHKGAEKIELTTERPNRSKCEYLGEIIGSQGNWVTGDFTSNEDLIVGARNELKNKAFKLGANIVYVEGMANTNGWGSLGTTNSTAIGKAFKCKY
ncbi:DUF4156 domain-containing protein [Vibrionales bacterium C3R12]|nr:DUF4156 domain-containing protein [Vibrionales bacterium C3R12]